jgi:integrase
MSRLVEDRSSSAPTSYRLLEVAYAPTTVTKYKSAAIDFYLWCRDNDETARDPDHFDALLVEYLHDMLESGQGKTKAVATVFGIIMYLPRLRQHLPTARLALRGWDRLQPSQPFPPLTWELTLAIAFGMRRHRSAQAFGPLAAIATLLAFDCYLRINELLQLRKEDVADVGDLRLNGFSATMALRLRRTKTGTNKWVELRDPDVMLLTRAAMRHAVDGALLFPFSANFYRRLFKTVCSELRLSSKYVPHSLRHGAATRDFQRRMPMEEILVRGRWASTKSARHYIQSGAALLLSTQVPPDVHALGRLLSSRPSHYFSLSQ